MHLCGQLENTDTFLIRTCSCCYFHAGVYPFLNVSKFCAKNQRYQCSKLSCFPSKANIILIFFNWVWFTYIQNLIQRSSVMRWHLSIAPSPVCSYHGVLCSVCHTMLQWDILMSGCAGMGREQGWSEDRACLAVGHCSASSPSPTLGSA